MLSSKLVSAIAATCISAAASVSAGVVWKSKSTDAKGGSAERTIQISGQRMRIDDSPQSTTILRLDKGLMWSLDPQASTYRELTFAEMGAAMDEMQKALADMPPEQRAMVEKLMGGKRATDLALKITPTGETKTIADHACTVYKMEAGPLNATFCAAKDLKPSAEATAFYEALGDTIGKTPGLEAIRAQADAYKQIDGVPLEEVIVIKVAGHETRQAYTFVSYETADVPASAFEIPSAFKKIDSGLPKKGALAK